MTYYLTSPTGGYATTNTLAGALALEKVSSFRRCDRATYVRTQRQANAMPPAPEPNQLVRVPLDHLNDWLTAYGLRITRRVDLPAGGWHVELADANPSKSLPAED